MSEPGRLIEELTDLGCSKVDAAIEAVGKTFGMNAVPTDPATPEKGDKG